MRHWFGNPMHIIYLTDIHDNFSGVSTVLNNTQADLYVLSGDLTYHAFGSDDNALFRFIELQEKIRLLLGEKPEPTATLELAKTAQLGDDALGLSSAEGGEYIKLAARAKAELLRKYQTLQKAILPTGKKCITIPGNYDLPLSETAVAAFDIHQKRATFDGITFAGYGSAPIFTPGIPEELAARFEESGVGSSLKSRPYDFMTAQKSDVFVLHNPAYGTLDKLARRGHCGSQGLRSAVEEMSPRLVLSGHVHEHYGLMKMGQTWFLNPSCFGSVEGIDGRQPGGYFASLVLQYSDDNVLYLREVVWKRLHGGKIDDLCQIKIDKKFRASEQVITTSEFEPMERFLL